MLFFKINDFFAIFKGIPRPKIEYCCRTLVSIIVNERGHRQADNVMLSIANPFPSGVLIASNTI